MAKSLSVLISGVLVLFGVGLLDSATASVQATSSSDVPRIDALAKAKADYTTATERLCEDLRSALTEKKRGLAGGESLVAEMKRFDAEREDLDLHGVWPPSLRSVPLTMRRSSDRAALLKAFRAAQVDANKAGIDKAAYALEEDILAFNAVSDLAGWRSLSSSAEHGIGVTAWQIVGETLTSPSLNNSAVAPEPLSWQDAPSDAAQFEIEFVVSRITGSGFTVRGIGPWQQVVDCHVTSSQIETVLANRLFGRDGARALVTVQEGYFVFELEGCPLLRQLAEVANAKSPESQLKPWFSIVPDRTTQVTVSSPRWKPLLVQSKAVPPKESVDSKAAPDASTPPVPKSNRSKPGQPRASSRGSGNDASAAAEKRALVWLQAHQSPDGGWECEGFPSRCKENRCDGVGTYVNDVGVSALATLCFLRARENAGDQFEDTLSNALKYLRDAQNPGDGCFGPSMGGMRKQYWLYNHAYATLAIAEAYAITHDENLRLAAQHGVTKILACQNPYSGWRYDFPPTGETDTCLTALMVIVLKKAADAGIAIGPDALESALCWIDDVTDRVTYRVGYLKDDMYSSARLPAVGNRYPAARVATMTALGVLVRKYAAGKSVEKSSAYIRDKGIAVIAGQPPTWTPPETEGGSSVDFYYWYYGTLAVSETGGKEWPSWSKSMRSVLLENQKLAAGQCDYGSWEPADAWSSVGGRVYSTSLNCLTLQLCDKAKR